MRTELLNMPERRASNVHELLTFFRDVDGGRATELTMRFIRSFAGTTFCVPGVQFLAELNRDEEILRALLKDSSASSRVAILVEHKVPYAVLENVYRVCTDKNLEPPLCPHGRAQAIEEAAEWIRKCKALTNEIVAMYALTALERARVMAAVNTPGKEIMAMAKTTKTLSTTPAVPQKKVEKKVAKKPTPKEAPSKAAAKPRANPGARVGGLTAAQRTLLGALKKSPEQAATPRELARVMGTISPTKTIRSLITMQMVSHPSKDPTKPMKVNIPVRLTKKGAAAV